MPSQPWGLYQGDHLHHKWVIHQPFNLKCITLFYPQTMLISLAIYETTSSLLYCKGPIWFSTHPKQYTYSTLWYELLNNCICSDARCESSKLQSDYKADSHWEVKQLIVKIPSLPHFKQRNGAIKTSGTLHALWFDTLASLSGYVGLISHAQLRLRVPVGEK